MKTLSAEQLYFLHDFLTIFMIGACFIVIYLGLTIKNNKHKTYISYGLISFAIIQEVLDYLNRIFFLNQYILELYNHSFYQDC